MALAAADVDPEDAVVGFAAGADAVDQRLDDAVGEFRDQSRERGTDDHRDGQVDDVAPGQKLLEALQHALESLLHFVCYLTNSTLVVLSMRRMRSGASFAGNQTAQQWE